MLLRLFSLFLGSYEDDGAEYTNVLDLLVREMSGLPAHSHNHLHDPVPCSCRRERETVQLLSTDTVLLLHAVLSYCYDCLLFYGQHILQ